MMAGFVLCSQFMPRAMSLTMHMRLDVENMREGATSAHSSNTRPPNKLSLRLLNSNVRVEAERLVGIVDQAFKVAVKFLHKRPRTC
jgi:hypothetical protein